MFNKNIELSLEMCPGNPTAAKHNSRVGNEEAEKETQEI